MTRDLVILGGGEHAGVVIDAARSRPDLWRVVGFLAGATSERMERLGVPHLGDDADAERLLGPSTAIVLGVGAVSTTSARPQIVERHRALADRWVSIVHERAWISPGAKLGPGCVVMAGAIVNLGTEVGSHCVINSGAIVEHDCRLGAFVLVAPGAVVGGGCAIGEGSFLGLGSRIRDHVTIGTETLVGMGAVVTTSAGDRQTLLGVPAKASRSDG